MTSAAKAAASVARHRRAERFRRRDLVWEVGAVKRTQQCGRRTTGETADHEVQVVHGPHGAGFRGVAYCGSVWSCPVCSAVIRTKRAAELMLAIERHLAAGGALLFVTFKVPHARKDTLEESLTRLRRGFHAFKRNRAGRHLLAGVGHVGHVSAVEVTDGRRNGWHPHLHVLFFLSQAPSQDALDHFRGKAEAEWLHIAEKAQWPSLPRRDRAGVFQGLDVQQVVNARDAGRYVIKVQGEDGRDYAPHLEMTRGDMKDGRRSDSLTPFELLDGYAVAVADKGPRAGRRWAARWREYEATMKGRRCIVWSKGLRESLGLGQDVDDEQLAEEIRHEDAAVIARIDRGTWRMVLMSRQRHRVLDCAELHGAPAVELLLEQIRRRWEAAEQREPLA